MSSRVIFMGTPDFAVPALRMLSDRIPRDQLLVVTQPDRASGRGRHLQSPPVKQFADERGIAAEQAETLRDPDVRERMTSFAPDLIVVAAFALLLPTWVLDLPTFGCVNLHASLLPRFRGASPIPAAIATGDETTGITLMKMERGLDTGAVYAMQDEIIRPKDTTASLTARLAEVAGEVLHHHLDGLLKADIVATPQRGQVVETRKITKAHGAIDWTWSAARIERHVRAMWPWPRAWTTIQDGMRLQVHESSVLERDETMAQGTVAHDTDGILVATGDGRLRLDMIQLPGKRAQPSSELIQHPSLAERNVLGQGDNVDIPAPWIVATGYTN